MSDKEASRPSIRILPDSPREPVTLAVADRLDESGLHELAIIARKLAIDRPRCSLLIAFARRWYMVGFALGLICGFALGLLVQGTWGIAP